MGKVGNSWNGDNQMPNKLKQLWGRHILLSIGSIIFAILLISSLQVYIEVLPRSILPFLATVLSTLLGLTFAAFAIFTAFMPNIRADYVGTATFLNQARTFIFTIYLQVLSLTFTFIEYLLFNTNFNLLFMYMTIVLVIWAFVFFIVLVHNTFHMFKSVRNQIISKVK